ncbi:MAG: hypothetical protein Ta2D_09040 [Rickettsiales bacterium]|nr:MAG: hypothetical protein Ta2D_09040 [Rickettsiales bacterium]
MSKNNVFINKKMTFLRAIKNFYYNYFNFKGIATQKESVFISFYIAILHIFCYVFLKTNIIYWLNFIPLSSFIARRLRDAGYYNYSIAIILVFSIFYVLSNITKTNINAFFRIFFVIFYLEIFLCMNFLATFYGDNKKKTQLNKNFFIGNGAIAIFVFMFI